MSSPVEIERQYPKSITTREGWVDVARKYLLGTVADDFLRITHEKARTMTERAMHANVQLRGALTDLISELSSTGSIARGMGVDGESMNFLGGVEAWERIAQLQNLLLKNDHQIMRNIAQLTTGQIASLSSSAVNVAQAGLAESQRVDVERKRLRGMDKLPVINIEAETQKPSPEIIQ